MTYKIKNALEDAAVLAIEIAVLAAFGGIFLSIGYMIGYSAGEGEAFIHAFNQIKDALLP
jgi:hypothetical protein